MAARAGGPRDHSRSGGSPGRGLFSGACCTRVGDARAGSGRVLRGIMGGVADVKESKAAAGDAGRVGHPRLSKETAPDTAGATHDQPNRPTQAAAGDMAMQRSASAPLQVGAPAGPADPGWGVTKPAVTDDTPAIISIEFDEESPWLFSVAAPTEESAIATELYGDVAVPINSTEVREWSGLLYEKVTRYVAYPQMLKANYRAAYASAMSKRKADLTAELKSDVARIQQMPLQDVMAMIGSQDELYGIIRRWAEESFPSRNTWLDQLFFELDMISVDVGTLTTQHSNLYSVILNHTAIADRVRQFRDSHTPIHTHD